MNYKNIITSIIILLVCSFIYKQFRVYIDKRDLEEELNIIDKYFMKKEDSSEIKKIEKNKKPILWMHIPYEINSRKWLDYGSRNSTSFNQDYIFYCINSILKQNANDYNIVFINDKSFYNLLDNWTINIDNVSEPQKSNIRLLGISKLLYKYGGLYLDNGFICFKSFLPLSEKILDTKKMLVGEFPNKSKNNMKYNFIASNKLMGCVKECIYMKELEQFLSILISKDYTEELKIKGTVDDWLNQKLLSNEISCIEGRFIGTRDYEGKEITIEDLFSSSYLQLDVDVYSLYVPYNDIKKMKKYNWFIYLELDAINDVNNNLAKYLVMANRV